jgi:hypothetical protein
MPFLNEQPPVIDSEYASLQPNHRFGPATNLSSNMSQLSLVCFYGI